MRHCSNSSAAPPSVSFLSTQTLAYFTPFICSILGRRFLFFHLGNRKEISRDNR
jgi:hypothetical protein